MGAPPDPWRAVVDATEAAAAERDAHPELAARLDAAGEPFRTAGTDVASILDEVDRRAVIDVDAPLESSRPVVPQLKGAVRKAGAFVARHVAQQTTVLVTGLSAAVRRLDERVQRLEPTAHHSIIGSVPDLRPRVAGVLDALERSGAGDPARRRQPGRARHAAARHRRPRRRATGWSTSARSARALDGLERMVAAVAPGGWVAVVSAAPDTWDDVVDPVVRDLGAPGPLHPQTWAHLLEEHGGADVQVHEGDGASRDRGAVVTAVHSIHQIVPTLSPGDAVGGHTLAVRDTLREAGLRSDIFCDDVAPALQHEARPLDDLPAPGAPGVALLYQCSIGNEVVDRLLARPEPLIVDYHNLTPVAHLLRWAPDMAHLVGWGRSQLSALAARSVLGIGDSAFNADDLAAAGFARVAVVPILLDVADLRHAGRGPARARRSTVAVRRPDRAQQGAARHRPRLRVVPRGARPDGRAPPGRPRRGARVHEARCATSSASSTSTAPSSSAAGSTTPRWPASTPRPTCSSACPTTRASASRCSRRWPTTCPWWPTPPAPCPRPSPTAASSSPPRTPPWSPPPSTAWPPTPRCAPPSSSEARAGRRPSTAPAPPPSSSTPSAPSSTCPATLSGR